MERYLQAIRNIHNAQKNLKVAEAAKYAPIAGVYSKAGEENMTKEVETKVHDLNVSKDLIQMGMMGSMPGRMM